jgi:hypothetical protein
MAIPEIHKVMPIRYVGVVSQFAGYSAYRNRYLVCRYPSHDASASTIPKKNIGTPEPCFDRNGSMMLL